MSTADNIRNAVFAIADASRASAQAAHDARQPEVDRLKAEVARLRRRLENDRVWRERGGELVEEPADLPESQDGIACRDETIKLQDEHIDRLKALNAELLKALKNAAAYLEAQRCWLKSDANPAAHGQPLHLREAASEQVSAELTQIYAAIANAERAK